MKGVCVCVLFLLSFFLSFFLPVFSFLLSLFIFFCSSLWFHRQTHILRWKLTFCAHTHTHNSYISMGSRESATEIDQTLPESSAERSLDTRTTLSTFSIAHFQFWTSSNLVKRIVRRTQFILRTIEDCTGCGQHPRKTHGLKRWNLEDPSLQLQKPQCSRFYQQRRKSWCPYEVRNQYIVSSRSPQDIVSSREIPLPTTLTN